MIKITFPDGQVREFENGITPFQVALSISEGLARNVLAANFAPVSVPSAISARTIALSAIIPDVIC
jgi:threonyl-tRNA synthetase